MSIIGSSFGDGERAVVVFGQKVRSGQSLFLPEKKWFCCTVLVLLYREGFVKKSYQSREVSCCVFLKRLRILTFICRVRGKREGKLPYGATDALSRIGSKACVQAYQIAKRTRNHVIDCVNLS